MPPVSDVPVEMILNPPFLDEAETRKPSCDSGPVGLRIGAKTPAEIAVSIVAQIIECKNVQRVRHRDEQLVPQLADRRELVGARHLFRHEILHLLGDAQFGKIHGGRIEAAAHG